MRCLLLAAVVLVMAGCGGPPDRRLSKIEYVLHAQAIERNDEPAAVGPFEDVVGHDLPRPYCVKRLHDLRDALQKLVDDARGLNPPRRLERLHDDFLVDAQASVDAVGAVADQVERRSLRCGFEMDKTIYGMPSTDRAERDLEKLADLGVPLCITTCE